MPWHSKLSLNFLVETFIIISHDISHCICSMFQHTDVCCHVHLYFMASTFWYYRHQCIHITLTALELCLLHKEFRHCSLANKCQWQHIFSQYTADTLMRRHSLQTSTHTKWTLCSHLSPVYIKRNKNYSVIHLLMTYNAFTTLADLWFKLQLASHADNSVCSQLHTLFCQFDESHYINQQGLMNH